MTQNYKEVTSLFIYLTFRFRKRWGDLKCSGNYEHFSSGNANVGILSDFDSKLQNLDTLRVPCSSGIHWTKLAKTGTYN